MSREEQIAPSHLAVLRVAVNVVPACVLNESGVLYVESPPYQAFREVCSSLLLLMCLTALTVSKRDGSSFLLTRELRESSPVKKSSTNGAS